MFLEYSQIMQVLQLRKKGRLYDNLFDKYNVS